MSGTVAALALLSALLSAAATVLIRQGLRGSSPYTGVWINMAVGAVCLWGAVLVTGGMGRPTPTAFALFVLAGLIGTVAGRLLRFFAIDTVGASITGAFMNVTPLVSSGLAILLLGEHVTLPIVLGTLVIVAGATLLSTGGRSLGVRPVQLWLPILSATCFGIVAILRKLGLSGMAPVPGTAVNVTTALVVFTGFLVASGQSRAMVCRGPSLVYFVAAGLTENLGVFLVVLALSLGTVSVVAPLTNATPLFVIVFSLLFLRGIETLNARVIGGSVLVVVGAVLITALGRP
ncbi:MAG TPA: EamA family transporter [Methylomirabilota bacterium]|nr:EamA family transporter [Methylomirabilota bacterium]